MKLIQTVSNDRDQDLIFFKYPHSFFSQLIAGVCPATGDLRLHASRYWLVQCFPFLARCQDDLCTTKIHEPTRLQKFTASKMGLCRWVWKWGMGPWVMISLVFFGWKTGFSERWDEMGFQDMFCQEMGIILAVHSNPSKTPSNLSIDPSRYAVWASHCLFGTSRGNILCGEEQEDHHKKLGMPALPCLT